MADKRKVPEIRLEGFSGEWEEHKLGEVVEFYSGLTYSPINVIKEGGTFVLRSSNIKNGEIIDADNVFVISDFAKSKNVEVGDIIVVVRNGSRSLIGKHAQVKKKMDNTVIGAFMTGIRFENYSFLNALLNTCQFDREIEKNIGATINQITIGSFNVMEFFFPNADEQNKIGYFFDQLDLVISLHQRKYDKLTTVKNAMIYKMFPNGSADVPEIRFKGFADKWEQRKLGEITTPCAEPVPTPKDGYWRLGIRSHAKGTFHSFVQPGKELETAKMHKVRANNFIVNITFAWEHAVAITDGSDDGKLVSHRFPQFGFNDGMVPDYFKPLILDKRFKYHLWLSSPGGAGRNRVLKINEMLEYPFWVPKETEQAKIANFFNNLDSLISLQQRELDKLKNIKKACLEKMFI